MKEIVMGNLNSTPIVTVYKSTRRLMDTKSCNKHQNQMIKEVPSEKQCLEVEPQLVGHATKFKST